MLTKLMAVLLAAVVSVSAAFSQSDQKAISAAFTSSDLKWAPCPEFIPKGCEIAVLQGDPSKQNADIFFKVPADFNIPSHTHTSAERMVLVSGKLLVTYDGQKTATLTPGMYAYGPAKLPHKAYCAKGAPCVLFIAFEEPVDAVPVTTPAKGQ